MSATTPDPDAPLAWWEEIQRDLFVTSFEAWAKTEGRDVTAHVSKIMASPAGWRSTRSLLRARVGAP